MRMRVASSTSIKLLSRRSFLAALGGLTANSALAGSTLAESLQTQDGSAPLFASAYRQANGDFGIGLVDELGQVLARITLPGRGHGFAVAPDRSRLVAFARRPGNFAVIVRPLAGISTEILVAEPGRHFFGHGCFSRDGRLLYAVENDFDTARGVIGIYDLSGPASRRIGEFATHGIGPHEALLSQDGRVLIVANGGIETHPASGREKLNLDTMAPSIAFLEAETGDLLSRQELGPALHQLSLRHMALDANGRAWVGGQFEGPADGKPPLVAVFSRDETPKLLELPDKVSSGLENYIGSVATNRSGEVVATSAPRGGKTLFWKADTGSYLGSQTIVDGCGVAPIDQGSFLVSDGNGALSYVLEPDSPAEVIARTAGLSWDNHMVALT